MKINLQNISNEELKWMESQAIQDEREESILLLAIISKEFDRRSIKPELLSSF